MNSERHYTGRSVVPAHPCRWCGTKLREKTKACSECGRFQNLLGVNPWDLLGEALKAGMLPLAAFVATYAFAEFQADAKQKEEANRRTLASMQHFYEYAWVLGSKTDAVRTEPAKQKARTDLDGVMSEMSWKFGLTPAFDEQTRKAWRETADRYWAFFDRTGNSSCRGCDQLDTDRKLVFCLVRRDIETLRRSLHEDLLVEEGYCHELLDKLKLLKPTPKTR